MKGEIYMRELSLVEQQELYGGSPIMTALIYVLLGSAIVKVITSKRGRINVRSILNIEWSE